MSAVQFIADHEGFVSKAYCDSGGVVTIGYGFTQRSRVFGPWWLALRGHALRMGDSISRAEADLIFASLLAEEYTPPVVARFPASILLPNRRDAAVSVCYNCGAGTLKDRWAKALADGSVPLAAGLLRSTRVTAGGKKLAGLVRRRADEARLLETGDYGKVSQAAVSQTAEEVREYQGQLKVLGLYVGKTDGDEASSRSAVINFQSQYDLKIDGVVGPATRASLNRAVDALQHKQVGAIAAGGGGIGAGGAESPADASWLDLPTLLTIGKWAVIIGAVVVVASFAWRYRGLLTGKRTPT